MDCGGKLMEADPYYGPYDSIYIYIIAFVTLGILPIMIIWWLVTQLVNRRRRKAGTPTGGSRWHFLRYGPTAPLICAAVFILGMSIWIIRPDPEVLSPSVRFCLLVMAVAGAIAFAISWLLWEFSNAPPRPKSTAK
jgi:hypothetical protein